ncbi:hypothetical protein U1Q18_016716 [Sarracenia purpurea var. burkii]
MGEEISMKYVLEKLREKGKEMGTDDWMIFVLDKLKEWLVVLQNFGGSLIAKVDEAFPPETRAEQLKHWLQVAKDDWMIFVLDKLKEWLVVLQNFGGSLIAKVDEAFPPETRAEQLKHWLQVAKDEWMIFVLDKLKECFFWYTNDFLTKKKKFEEWLVALQNFGGSLIAKVDESFPPETRAEQLKHWFPFIIAGVVLVIFFGCCRRCCGGRRAVKMMKAPGRGHRMPRSAFEGNPKSYFRGLLGKPTD